MASDTDELIEVVDVPSGVAAAPRATPPFPVGVLGAATSRHLTQGVCNA
jgi:hypothetical protein